MKKVTGLGGVFFKTRDRNAMKDWYRNCLGIESDEYGFMFRWSDENDSAKKGYTVWSPFPPDTEYFNPSEQPFMINYRVDDLEGLIASLKESGVKVLGEIQKFENGQFAWIMDPEGNKIELWEPVDSDKDPYLK